MNITKTVFLSLLFFSFYTTKPSSYSLRDSMPGYKYDPNYKQRDQEYIELMSNDNSPRISKDQVPKELLTKVETVFCWVNLWEHDGTAEGVGNKIKFHHLNAKIQDEGEYKGYDTVLTEKRLAFITKWVDEKYEERNAFYQKAQAIREYNCWMNKYVYLPLTVAAIVGVGYGIYKGARLLFGYDSQENKEPQKDEELKSSDEAKSSDEVESSDKVESLN
jgi:hypothetical protein